MTPPAADPKKVASLVNNAGLFIGKPFKTAETQPGR
jgi:NADP-dependent 3-hydroxy acid dehydrogenase YdfG